MGSPTETAVEDEIYPKVDELDRPPKRKKKWLVIAIAGLTALVIAWIYVLFFYHPALLIDELADKTFPRQAEQICSAADDQLNELPFPSLSKSATERADNVEKSNIILRDMIAELRPLAPDSPSEAAEAVNEWLDDWDVYIGDREQYVDNLRKDPKARFLESPKGGDTKGITRAIDGYAQVNSMLSCQTPEDVA